jgi:hypothetical protein
LLVNCPYGTFGIAANAKTKKNIAHLATPQKEKTKNIVHLATLQMEKNEKHGSFGNVAVGKTNNIAHLATLHMKK